jgi:hypothetical protein
MMEKRGAKLAIVASLALAGSLTFAAGTPPVRLLGVSSQGNAVLIESSEPVAYVVKRPDALTVLVELRNVSVANAANAVERRDPIAGIAVEQASADGQAIGRVSQGRRRRHSLAQRRRRPWTPAPVPRPPRRSSRTCSPPRSSRKCVQAVRTPQRR